MTYYHYYLLSTFPFIDRSAKNLVTMEESKNNTFSEQSSKMVKRKKKGRKERDNTAVSGQTGTKKMTKGKGWDHSAKTISGGNEVDEKAWNEKEESGKEGD